MIRTTFIASFALTLILAIVSVVLSPPRVAVHFSIGGEPDSWTSAYVSALIMAGVNLLLFVLFLLAPRLIRVTPKAFINLFNKDFWLSADNRSRAEAIISTEMYLFGTGTFVFLFIVGLLALEANLSTPVKFREGLFWGPFALYMGFAVYWAIRILRKFKMPSE